MRFNNSSYQPDWQRAANHQRSDLAIAWARVACSETADAEDIAHARHVVPALADLVIRDSAGAEK